MTTDDEWVVERGETYEHAAHGTVEVVGLWRGMRSIDSAGNIDEPADADPIMIVCYTIADEDGPVAELSQTLDEFLNAVA